MNARAPRRAAAALAICVAFAAAPPACAAPGPEAPLRAVVFFTGDVLGYTEPCG